MGEAPTYREQFSAILEVFTRLIFQYKPAFVTLIILGILVGAFSFAQNSLPGDLLYPIKKIVEKSQAIFVSEDEKPRAQLELVNKRLEELAKIAENNQTQKLAPALDEVKTFKNIAKKELSKAISNKSKTEAVKIAKEIASKLKEMGEKEKKVFSALGVEPLESENNEASEKIIAEILINDLKNSSLTEKQQTLLTEAEEYYKIGNYSLALEKILQLSAK